MLDGTSHQPELIVDASDIGTMTSVRNKCSKYLARMLMSAVCVLPVADTVLSDAAFLKARDAVNASIGHKNEVVEQVLENGLLGAIIYSESFLLGLGVCRYKRLQGAFDGYGEYSAKRREEMGPYRTKLSEIASLPYLGLEKMGNASERHGARMAASNRSKGSKWAAEFLIDAGKTNAMGTTTVLLDEAGSSPEPIPIKRVHRLAWIITASWLGAAAVITNIYDAAGKVPIVGDIVQGSMDAFGAAFNMATTVDIQDPLQTPVGTGVMGFIGASLAATGWKIAKFNERKRSTTDEVDTLVVTPGITQATASA